MTTILKKLQIPLLATLALAWIPQNPAHAARACGEREKFTKQLADKYKELPRALGVAGTGKAVFEVYVSPEGNWTLLMTTAKGASCIMATGHSWQQKDKLAFLPQS